MTRLTPGFFAVATLLLLAACTGTSEPLTPTLLVTGYGGTSDPKVALIRDDLSVTPTRLAFLPESVRPLSAPSVAYDVVDRERARSALVVLSRNAAKVTDGAGDFLTTFSLTGIDPEAPAAFAQRGDVALGDFEVVPRPLQGQLLAFCPTRVQVTQGGDYAAVLNEPSICGLQAPPFIDILDLRGTRLLERIGGVSRSGLYLSQGATQDLLYYATPEAGVLRLRRSTLPRPGQLFGPDDTVANVPVVAFTPPRGETDAVDLQSAGADTEERLVFLFRDSLVNITGFSGTGQAGGIIDTARDNASVIRNDKRSTEGTFILSTPGAGVFTFVPPPSEDETLDRESARVIATGAVIEPTRNLVYFVADPRATAQGENVTLFNLNDYEVGDPLSDLGRVSVPQLTRPTFVTWAQSAPRRATP